MMENYICALLFADTRSARRSKEVAASFADCPHVSFMACKGTQLFATYFLPEQQKWWINSIAEKP